MIYVLLAFCAWLVWLWFTRLDIKHPETGKVYLRRFHLKREWGWLSKLAWLLWDTNAPVSPWLLDKIQDFAERRVFLHRIYTADPDRHMHNHPWRFGSGSYILWGGYQEHRARVLAKYPTTGKALMTDFWFQWNYRGNTMTLDQRDYHKITFVKPNTWTLFFAGRRNREWGFLVDGEHVDYRKYLGLPEDHKIDD